MASPESLRAGLAANLAALPFQAHAYVLANPSPPCAYISSGPIEYDQAFARGHDLWTFVVYVLVGLTTDIGAQKKLDTMLASSGSQSVKTLLESDKTLGGAAFSVHVLSTTGAREYALAGTSVLGAEWTVEVRAAGN